MNFLLVAAILGTIGVVGYFAMKNQGQASSENGNAPTGDIGGGSSNPTPSPIIARKSKLSSAEIAQYASDAGFDGEDLVTAVAVALAESSGNTGAVGDLNLTPGGSIGLWQINLKAHPDWATSDLTDPAVNAAAAFDVYRKAGSSFRPWSTFKNGAYVAHLDAAQQGVEANA